MVCYHACLPTFFPKENHISPCSVERLWNYAASSVLGSTVYQKEIAVEFSGGSDSMATYFCPNSIISVSHSSDFCKMGLIFLSIDTEKMAEFEGTSYCSSMLLLIGWERWKPLVFVLLKGLRIFV